MPTQRNVADSVGTQLNEAIRVCRMYDIEIGMGA